jgi:hypothetical protein
VPAIAAPFCVVSEAVPAQCIYYDAGMRQQRADQMGAGWECTVNTKEVKPTPSVGLVTSGRVSLCIYPDLDTCHKEATHQQAACIIAPTRPGRPTPDPFMLTRPGKAGLF